MAENNKVSMMNEEETSSSFKARVWDVVRGGYIALGLSLGHKLGLFDLLAKLEEPKTSEEIADMANYKERYVREWLGLMVVGKIITADREGTHFYLPRSRIKTLTGPASIPFYSQPLPILAEKLSLIVSYFDKDGPSGEACGHYSELYDYVDDIHHQTLQPNNLAKNKDLHALLEGGCHVADIGCSCGTIIRQIAEAYPKSHFTGMDIREDAIAKGNAAIKENGPENVKLMVQDCFNMPQNWSGYWDCIIICDVAHDLPFPMKLFQEVYRLLKTGGFFVLVEINLHNNPVKNIDKPPAAILYGMSLFHCIPVSCSGPDGGGWGCTWGKDKVMELLREVGFQDLDIQANKHLEYLCIARKF